MDIRNGVHTEPLKVSFHPNGLHIAIMFKLKVLCYDILDNCLSQYKTSPFIMYSPKDLITEDHSTDFTTSFGLVTSPKDIKFSNFGSLLGICNGNTVKIFNFFTETLIFDTNDSEKKKRTS